MQLTVSENREKKKRGSERVREEVRENTNRRTALPLQSTIVLTLCIFPKISVIIATTDFFVAEFLKMDPEHVIKYIILLQAEMRLNVYTLINYIQRTAEFHLNNYNISILLLLCRGRSF